MPKFISISKWDFVLTPSILLKHLCMSVVIFKKLFVTLSLERSMPFKGMRLCVSSAQREIVADFFFRCREDACTSMTCHRVWAVCPYLKGSRYYLLLTGCDSSVLFYNKRYGTR